MLVEETISKGKSLEEAISEVLQTPIKKTHGPRQHEENRHLRTQTCQICSYYSIHFFTLGVQSLFLCYSLVSLVICYVDNYFGVVVVVCGSFGVLVGHIDMLVKVYMMSCVRRPSCLKKIKFKFCVVIQSLTIGVFYLFAVLYNSLWFSSVNIVLFITSIATSSLGMVLVIPVGLLCFFVRFDTTFVVKRVQPLTPRVKRGKVHTVGVSKAARRNLKSPIRGMHITAPEIEITSPTPVATPKGKMEVKNKI